MIRLAALLLAVLALTGCAEDYPPYERADPSDSADCYSEDCDPTLSGEDCATWRFDNSDC